MSRTPRDESDGMIMTLDFLLLQILAYLEISGDAKIDIPWLYGVEFAGFFYEKSCTSAPPEVL